MSQMSHEIMSLHIHLVPLSIFFKGKNIHLQDKTAEVRCLDIFVLGVAVSSVKSVKLAFAAVGVEAAKPEPLSENCSLCPPSSVSAEL